MYTHYHRTREYKFIMVNPINQLSNLIRNCFSDKHANAVVASNFKNEDAICCQKCKKAVV